MSFPKDLCKLLEPAFKQSEFPKYFTLVERKQEWVLKVKQALEPRKLEAIQTIVRSCGGAYHPRPPTYQIPKGRMAEASSSVNPKDDTKLITEKPQLAKHNKNEYDLRKSVDILPFLKKAFPIIKDDKNVRVDGHHRHQIDPKWPAVTVHFENENQRKIARFVANFCRRNVTDKEKRDFLVALTLETGWNAEEMADKLPVSYSWIMKFLPDEYKDKVKAEAGAKGGEALKEKYRESQDSALRYEAKNAFGRITRYPCGFPGCQLTTINPPSHMGVSLCAYHSKAVEKDETLVKKIRKREPIQPRTEKISPSLTKPRMSYAERQALMHSSESRMDDAMFLWASNEPKLKDAGWTAEYQKHYVIVHIEIRSDLTLRNSEQGRELSCFWDTSETHPDPNRDKRNRQRAADLHKIEIFSADYKAFTKTELERLQKATLKTCGIES